MGEKINTEINNFGEYYYLIIIMTLKLHHCYVFLFALCSRAQGIESAKWTS